MTTTPALARATAELTGGLPGLLPFIAAPFAHVIVSAALHDPDDPDWLATLLAESYPAGHLSSDRKTYLAHKAALRAQADAVRAAILGPSS